MKFYTWSKDLITTQIQGGGLTHKKDIDMTVNETRGRKKGRRRRVGNEMERRRRGKKMRACIFKELCEGGRILLKRMRRDSKSIKCERR